MPITAHPPAEARREHQRALRSYLLAFVALELLTTTTALVAQFDLGVWNTFVALLIAVVKSLLVVIFFMHVRRAARQTQLTVTVGVVWLLILLLLTITDYVTRWWGT